MAINQTQPSVKPCSECGEPAVVRVEVTFKDVAQNASAQHSLLADCERQALPFDCVRECYYIARYYCPACTPVVEERIG